MQNLRISIHALLAESDKGTTSRINVRINFYPRSPCGERLTQFWQLHPKYPISIHALLAESDRRLLYILCGAHDFYPRSPCGERRCSPGRCIFAPEFLSTLSLRRATLPRLPRPCPATYFYPRSPCGERQTKQARFSSWTYFYPRSPCGERLIDEIQLEFNSLISIHALLAESDSKSAQNSGVLLRI